MDRARFLAEKIALVKKELRQRKLDSLILLDEPSLRYLCGFFFEGAILLITRAESPCFFIDSMNVSLVRKLSKSLDLDVLVCKGSKLPSLKNFINENKVKKIGFNGYEVSVFLHSRLKRAMHPVKFCSDENGMKIGGILHDIRELKSQEEIVLIKKAAVETKKIWNEIKRSIEFGMREKEIAALIETTIFGRGYKTSFPTIAAVGKNTAFPHAVPTSSRLKEGEHLLVDFGIISDGYCSDLTRIWYKGKMNPQIRVFKDVVLKAQEIAFKLIAPGVKIGSILDAINGLFLSEGVSEYVLHGLGHGIGIEVHEAPSLRSDNTSVLKEGMTITVEPGLYKAGIGGVRQEDMVLVTAKGCEVLTL